MVSTHLTTESSCQVKYWTLEKFFIAHSESVLDIWDHGFCRISDFKQIEIWIEASILLSWTFDIMV